MTQMVHELIWSRDGMILTGKSKDLEQNLSQCHFFYHKSLMDHPEHEPRPP
jgi:hypothetical protein